MGLKFPAFIGYNQITVSFHLPRDVIPISDRFSILRASNNLFIFFFIFPLGERCTCLASRLSWKFLTKLIELSELIERSCNHPISRRQPPICRPLLSTLPRAEFHLRDVYKNNRHVERAPYAKRHVAEGQQCHREPSLDGTQKNVEKGCSVYVVEHLPASRWDFHQGFGISLRKRDYPLPFVSVVPVNQTVTRRSNISSGSFEPRKRGRFLEADFSIFQYEKLSLLRPNEKKSNCQKLGKEGASFLRGNFEFSKLYRAESCAR